jgi:hypothetical protein
MFGGCERMSSTILDLAFVTAAGVPVELAAAVDFWEEDVSPATVPRDVELSSVGRGGANDTESQPGNNASMASPEMSLAQRFSAAALTRPQLANTLFLNMIVEVSPISLTPVRGTLVPLVLGPSRVSLSS